MTTRIIGALEDGAIYDVQVTGSGDRPVIGSRRVRALVDAHAGKPLLHSPTGPLRDMDPTSAEDIVALLRNKTRVARVRRTANPA